MPGEMVEKLKKSGGRFAFEFFLEVWKDGLVEILKKWLSGITVNDIGKMVKKGKFPSTRELNLSALRPYIEHLERISVERMLEDFLVLARPDLVKAIVEMDMPGAQWLVNLRLYLLDQVRCAGVEEKQDIVQASCDNCGKSWPVLRSEANSIKECPFCHTGKDEPSKEDTP